MWQNLIQALHMKLERTLTLSRGCRVIVGTEDAGSQVLVTTENDAFGALAAQPTSGSVKLVCTRVGNLATLNFTLTAARIPVTDGGVSGAYGSLKLFDFSESGVVILGSRQNYTAFAEGSALTGGAGDAAFVMGLGSVAANVGDGALTGTEVDFGTATATITLSGGTGSGTRHMGPSTTALDGTTTAVDLYLNWCGTAATIDASSSIDVTGTITLNVLLQGDD